MKTKHPTLLLVLDGWGYREETEHNAIAMAYTPTWDHIWASYPHALLSGSGLDVGLPDGQMGNSEVGHMTIGAGRVLYQDLTKINLAIKDQSFFVNPVLTKAFEQSSCAGNAIHILGLLSSGGIHSHEEHLHALIKLAAQQHCKQIYIHAFLDGRDTPPKSAMASIIALEKICAQYNTGTISSVTGRYYAMDRDEKYDRTKLTYDLLTLGLTDYTANSALDALEQAYARGETDEFVKPTKIKLVNNTQSHVKDGDTVIFINFRTDRAKQLSYSLTDPEFIGFARSTMPKLKTFITFTKYAADLKAEIAFPKISPTNVLGEYLAKHKFSQLRLAETEKYAHVTFFFDGGQDCKFAGEVCELIPSPAVATYDLKPEMSAHKITARLTAAIASNKYNVIICNLANADMVGHTGNTTATIKAIETLDQCLATILKNILAVNGEILITADHGNAEFMYDDKTEQAHTAHTNALLPFIYIGNRKINFLQEYGTLSDIAPSLLTLLGLPLPKEMSGENLFCLSE